jgi:hypothetical protein
LPEFIGNGGGMTASSQVIHGQEKYLCGNVPALDILKLEENERMNLPSNLNLLFAGE